MKKQLRSWKKMGMNEPIESCNVTPVASEILEITWERVLPIWWGLTWRMSAFYLGVALLAALTGAETVFRLIALIFSIPLAVQFLGVALRQQYEEFSVRFIKTPVKEKKQAIT